MLSTYRTRQVVTALRGRRYTTGRFGYYKPSWLVIYQPSLSKPTIYDATIAEESCPAKEVQTENDIQASWKDVKQALCSGSLGPSEIWRGFAKEFNALSLAETELFKEHRARGHRLYGHGEYGFHGGL